MVSQGHLMIIIDNVGMRFLVKKKKTTSELLREGYEEEKKMLEDEEYLEEIKNKI